MGEGSAYGRGAPVAAAYGRKMKLAGGQRSVPRGPKPVDQGAPCASPILAFMWAVRQWACAGPTTSSWNYPARPRTLIPTSPGDRPDPVLADTATKQRDGQPISIHSDRRPKTGRILTRNDRGPRSTGAPRRDQAAPGFSYAEDRSAPTASAPRGKPAGAAHVFRARGNYGRSPWSVFGLAPGCRSKDQVFRKTVGVIGT